VFISARLQKGNKQWPKHKIASSTLGAACPTKKCDTNINKKFVPQKKKRKHYFTFSAASYKVL